MSQVSWASTPKAHSYLSCRPISPPSSRPISPAFWLAMSDEEVKPTAAKPIATKPIAPRFEMLGLRESEQLLDRTTKENFDLKLKLTFMEDALLLHSEGGVEYALRENANLKAQIKTARAKNKELEGRTKELEGLATTNADVRKAKIGELRDENAALKLKNEEYESQLNCLAKELEEADRLKIDYRKLQVDYEQQSAIVDWDAFALHEEAVRAQEEVRCRTIELESSQTEIAFLREEQDGFVTNVAQLEDFITNLQKNLANERKRVRNLNARLSDEQQQREASETEKLESQKLVYDLNHAASAARENSTKLKRRLSCTELEAKSSKDQISELEQKLNDRDALLETHGLEAKSAKDQISELEQKLNDRDTLLETHELEARSAKDQISELEQKLNDRDALLETHGLEARSAKDHISELEQKLNDRDTLLETHELEAKSAKDHTSELEQKLKDREALVETHGLESKKLSELLDRERQGRKADKAQHDQWQKTHLHTSRTVSQKDSRIAELQASLQVDRQKLANLEQISRRQLGERNELLLALWKRISTLCGSDWQHQNNLVNNHLPTVEVVGNMLPEFTQKLIAALETLESTLRDHRGRMGALERDLLAGYMSLEKKVEGMSKKLHELEAILQAQQLSATFMAVPELAKLRGENRLLKSELARVPRATIPNLAESSEQRWLHRLREMERRVKVEREARLLDRAGARRRLQEGEKEIDILRAELDRERSRGRRGGK